MRSIKKLLFLVAAFIAAIISRGQIIPLYDSIPNSKHVANREYADTTDGILIIHKVSRPTLAVFLPPEEKRNGSAVIICPGGGYHIVAAAHEGYDVAKKFNEMGVAAFVLKYRIPDDSTMIDKSIGPLQDAQRALLIVHERAKEWKLDSQRIGIMGFSAGGHLAATAGTHFRKSYIPNPDSISLRPAFMILVYPVISFTDSIGHIGSREQLLGKSPTPEQIKEYSNEWQITKQTPPAFLIHSRNDDVVKVDNSRRFADRLRKYKVSYELFLYEKGGHGYGLNNPTDRTSWMAAVERWMKKMKLIE